MSWPIDQEFRRNPGEPPTAAGHGAHILPHNSGDFLEGVFLRDAPEFEEWMLAQRVRYRKLALRCLAQV